MIEATQPKLCNISGDLNDSWCVAWFNKPNLAYD